MDLFSVQFADFNNEVSGTTIGSLVVSRLPAKPLGEDFPHWWLVEQLERAYLSAGPARKRESERKDLDAWLTFCRDLSVDVLEARSLHVAGFARYLTEVEGLSRTAVLRSMRTLDSFYGRGVTQNVVAHNPLA